MTMTNAAIIWAHKTRSS